MLLAAEALDGLGDLERRHEHLRDAFKATARVAIEREAPDSSIAYRVLEDGSGIAIQGGPRAALAVFAMGLGDMLDELKAPNYSETTLTAPDGRVFVVTVARKEGKTPHDLKLEADAARDAALADAQAANGAYKRNKASARKLGDWAADLSTKLHYARGAWQGAHRALLALSAFTDHLNDCGVHGPTGTCSCGLARVQADVETLLGGGTPVVLTEPLDLVLHCPKCGLQHVDAPEPGWDNPLHRSHRCRESDGGCGTVWRPADYATNGVPTALTRGSADTWPVQEARDGDE